ncbi:MAG: thioesterase family protein [Pseudomonadota bacterium]
MKRDQFKFFQDMRVRYAEVDSQGIVFNAHYLTYFDTAITEYMRNINYDYHTLVSRRGLDFHLVKSMVEYLKPIGFDEIIEIGVTAHKIGKSSLTWVLAIFKKGASECLAKGEIVWVCSKVGTNRSYPLPEDLVKLLSGYEKP